MPHEARRAACVRVSSPVMVRARPLIHYGEQEIPRTRNLPHNHTRPHATVLTSNQENVDQYALRGLRIDRAYLPGFQFLSDAVTTRQPRRVLTP